MIIDIRDELWEEFENIKMGACFMCYHDHEFYMRTYTNTSIVVNAVRLRDGYMTHFDPDTLVAPKNLIGKIENGRS